MEKSSIVKFIRGLKQKQNPNRSPLENDEKSIHYLEHWKVKGAHQAFILCMLRNFTTAQNQIKEGKNKSV